MRSAQALKRRQSHFEISEADGKITLTVTEEEEVNVSYVYAIGDTEVTIPQEILDKVAEEK